MYFYPMAMFTHRLIPPPTTVSSSLGEERSAKRGAVSIAVSPGIKATDKAAVKNAHATVVSEYEKLEKFHREIDEKMQKQANVDSNSQCCDSSSSSSSNTGSSGCCKTKPASQDGYVHERTVRPSSGG
jgi:hypothetical protein